MQRGHEANARGDYSDARAYFIECHRIGGRVEAKVSAANMSLVLGHFGEALQAYDEVLNAQPPPSATMVDVIKNKQQEALFIKSGASRPRKAGFWYGLCGDACKCLG